MKSKDTGRTAVNLRNLVLLFVSLVLASCQNEYMRNPFWAGPPMQRSYGSYGGATYGHRAPVTQSYYGYVPKYQYPPGVKGSISSRPKTTAKTGSGIETKRPTTTVKGYSQDRSRDWLPPIPTCPGYHARWDTRSFPKSKNGYYWVVDHKGNTWSMTPSEFYPFWSQRIWNYEYIQTFESYPFKRR